MPDDHPLQERVAALERRVEALEKGQPLPPPAGDSHYGLTVINRIGAVTVAIGIILLFKYAADNHWISAAGGVVLGLAAGALLIGLAEWIRPRSQPAFAQGVAGCGLAIVYIAIYAAQAYYHLIALPFAVAALAAPCALAFALSFRFEHIFLMPWNAFLFLAAEFAVLYKESPGTFVALATALAVAHFALNRRSRTFYLLGHACLLVAGLRGLDLGLDAVTSAANRGSSINASISGFMALYGLVMSFAGIWRGSSIDRTLGLTLLGLVIAKLYLYDVWQLSHVYRICAFVALGVLLLAASYRLGKR